MAKTLRRVLMLLIIIFLAMQLVPVQRTNPPVEAELEAPAAVMEVLRRACYDCHSNETTWPWYSRVAPVSWLVVHDVEEGREHLNFSLWGQMRPMKRVQMAARIWEEIEEGEMPLPIYLGMHAEARLGAADHQLLHEWSQSPEPASEPEQSGEVGEADETNETDDRNDTRETAEPHR